MFTLTSGQQNTVEERVLWEWIVTVLQTDKMFVWFWVCVKKSTWSLRLMKLNHCKKYCLNGSFHWNMYKSKLNYSENETFYFLTGNLFLFPCEPTDFVQESSWIMWIYNICILKSTLLKFQTNSQARCKTDLISTCNHCYLRI